jgi:Cytochrome P460
MSMRVGIKCCFAAALVLASCSCGGSRAGTSAVNERAALIGSLPWNPLQWNVITSLVDNGASTMSTLYGNDPAVRSARGGEKHYPAGAVISLVTWAKQEDERWFGARIPAQAKSVEFVSVTAGPAGQPSYSYQNFEGRPLSRNPANASRSPETRVAYLLSLRAAMMP